MVTRLRNIQVFAMINGWREVFRSQAENRKDKSVMFVVQGSDPNHKIRRTKILCGLEDEATQKDGEEIYKILPVVSIPEEIESFFQLQVVEISSPNIATVVCGERGQKLPAEWVSGSMAGFRRVEGSFYVVEASSLRNFGSIASCSIEKEGKDSYLVIRRIPADFRVPSTTISGEDEVPNIKWTDNAFLWIKETERAKAEKQFTEAAAQAWLKANHNCFREGCGPHYAITDANQVREYWKNKNTAKKYAVA